MNYKMKNRKLGATAAATLVASALTGWSTMAFAEPAHIQTDINVVNPDNNCKFEVNSGELGDAWTFTANTQAGTSTMVAEQKTNQITVVADGSASCRLNQVGLTATTTSPQSPFTRGRKIPTANGGYFLHDIYVSKVTGYEDSAQTTPIATRATQWMRTEGYVDFDGTNVPLIPANTSAPYSDFGSAPGGNVPAATTELSVSAPVYHQTGGPDAAGSSATAIVPGGFSTTYGGFVNKRRVHATDPEQELRSVTIDIGSMLSTHPLGAGNVADDLTVYDGETLSSTWTITVTPT